MPGQRHGARAVVERDVRRAARRAELVDAAVRVIRREGPGASMERIAAEAGITKPVLYRHFGDRVGLHTAVTDLAFERLGAEVRDALARLDVPPRQVVANAIDAYLSFIEREPALYQYLTVRFTSDDRTWRRSINTFLCRVGGDVAVVLREALCATGADSGAAEPWAFGLVGLVFSAGEWWLGRRTMSRQRLGAYLTDLVCDGLPGIGDVTEPTHDLLARSLPAGHSPRAAGRVRGGADGDRTARPGGPVGSAPVGGATHGATHGGTDAPTGTSVAPAHADAQLPFLGRRPAPAGAAGLQADQPHGGGGT